MVGSTGKRGKSTRQKTRKPRGKTDRQDLDCLIPGFHAVRETLKQPKSPLREIWITEEKESARAGEILKLAQSQNIPVYYKKNQNYMTRLKTYPIRAW